MKERLNQPGPQTPEAGPSDVNSVIVCVEVPPGTERKIKYRTYLDCVAGGKQRRTCIPFAKGGQELLLLCERPNCCFVAQNKKELFRHHVCHHVDPRAAEPATETRLPPSPVICNLAECAPRTPPNRKPKAGKPEESSGSQDSFGEVTPPQSPDPDDPAWEKFRAWRQPSETDPASQPASTTPVLAPVPPPVPEPVPLEPEDEARPRCSRKQKWGPFLLAPIWGQGQKIGLGATCKRHHNGDDQRCCKIQRRFGKQTEKELELCLKRWLIQGFQIHDDDMGRSIHLNFEPKDLPPLEGANQSEDLDAE